MRTPKRPPSEGGPGRVRLPDFLGDTQLRDWAACALYPLCRYLSQGAGPPEELLEARDALNCLIEAETAKRSLR